MQINVTSEVGRLRRVLVHRPGREIDWMVPAMMEELLFDDILYGEAARTEHEGFCEVLRRAGVETLYAGELLVEALAVEAAREEALEALARQAGPAVRAELETATPADLALALLGGLREPDAGGGARFRLAPCPNYFFQRDPQVVLGDRVVISAMATEARRREPLLARLIFRFHSAFAETPRVEVRRAGAGSWEDPGRPTLEGGDLLVASPEILLVGISERTNRRGVEVLAESLRREATSFRHLILVELPAKRSYMHLDTVFTFIDRGVGLAYLPVVEPGGPEAASVYSVDLRGRELSFTLQHSLRQALAAAGLEIDLVPCGGAADIVDQEREQWTDGANAFALAPGTILLYRRNRRTIEALAARGWRVLGEDEVLADPALLEAGRAVVTVVGHELSRARGGPRCMTMPLEREPCSS